MNEPNEGLARKRLLEVAREYEEKGYRVIVEPRGREIPSFLSGFEPDMIAWSDKENVIIEVKVSSGLAGSMYLTEIANRVSQIPGWRFELVAVKPKNPLEADELTSEEIKTRIAEARQLLNQDYDNAAMLLTWSAIEATLRLLARNSGISITTIPTNALPKQLFSLGLLDQEDYMLFQSATQLRNRIAHGFRSPELEHSFILTLIHTTERVLKKEAERRHED